MSAQHTPGPWKVRSSKLHLCVESFAGTVALVQKKSRHARYHDDARLIAAAPDMLAALRRAVLALAFAAEGSAAMNDDYVAVSLAIAKATEVAS